MDKVQGSAASLAKRLDELNLEEIRDLQGRVRDKQKMLEDTKSNLKTTSQALEKVIEEVEKRRREVVDQLVRFGEEKKQEIEVLTLEVRKLVKEIYGEDPGVAGVGEPDEPSELDDIEESSPSDWSLESD